MEVGVFSSELEAYLKEQRDPGVIGKDLSTTRQNLNDLSRRMWSSRIDVLGANDAVDGKDGNCIPIRIWRPKTAPTTRQRLALAVHGGGWSLGDEYADVFMASMLASELGMVVVTLDYRLAPEHPYPSALDDVHSVFSWITRNRSKLIAREHGERAHHEYDDQPVFLCGFSAGGNLAAALLLRLRIEGMLHEVAKAVLISPATCHYGQFVEARKRLDCRLDSIHSAESPLLTAAMLRAFWDNYVADAASGASPLVSPLLADNLKGLPSIYIQVAGADPLRDEAIAFHDALLRAGVDAEMSIYAGLPHGFQSELIALPSAKRATADFKAFLRR